MNEVTLRPMREEDRNYVFSSWLDCFFLESSSTRHILKSVFYPEYQKVIERILESPRTEVTIANLGDDPMLILGFLVHAEPLIHFCYVRKRFRRLGIAKTMIQALKSPTDTLVYTHRTFGLDPLLPKLQPMTYNPYRIP